MADQAATRQFIDDVLNTLPVTDRVFHGLKRTMPLVQELTVAIQELRPSGKVLIVGPNTLLPAALDKLGYDLELWHLPQGHLSGEIRRFVTRTAPLAELLACKGVDGKFDVIVLPYLLEAAEENPSKVLARFRDLLSDGGHLLVASRSSGRLLYRLRGALGLSQLADPYDEGPSVSLSWPPLPVRRLLDAGQIRRWATQAGFQIDGVDYLMDEFATLPIHAMTLQDWLIAQTSFLIRKTLPKFQDCILATLRPFLVESVENVPGMEPAVRPLASVVIAATDPARTANVLADLQDQTYPSELIEAVVVHPEGTSFESLTAREHPFRVHLVPVPSSSGPAAANAGLRQATGRVLGFTDDLCRLSRPWVESGVVSTSRWVGAATGAVGLEDNSRHFFEALPGAGGTRNALIHDRSIFPATNSFFLREPLLDIGGFDERFQTGSGPAWGWDTDAAHRLAAKGYGISYDQTLFVFRELPPRDRNWMQTEFRRAQQIPLAIRRLPELRRTLLKQRLFVTDRTRSFDVMMGGLFLAALFRKRSLLFWFSVPWFKGVVKMVPFWPPKSWMGSIRDLARLWLRHLIWFAGFLSGSAKSKRPVL